MRQTNNANLGYLTKFIEYYETSHYNGIRPAQCKLHFEQVLYTLNQLNTVITIIIYFGWICLKLQSKTNIDRSLAQFKKFFWLCGSCGWPFDWFHQFPSTLRRRCRSLMWMLNFNFVFVCFEVEDQRKTTTTTSTTIKRTYR